MSDSDDDMPLAQRAAQINSLTGLALPNNTIASMPVMKEEPSEYVITAKTDNEDSDDDMPLAQRFNDRSVKRAAISIKSESDDDDVPLAKKRKKVSLSRPKVKTEAANGKRKMDVDKKPSPAKRGKKEPEMTAAKKAKIKKEAEEAEIYKWWEEEEQKDMAEDDSIKWTKLEHSGVLFPPDYVPHGVKMKYDGKPIALSPEAEEVASFFAALLESDHGKNPTFQANFFKDWQKVLKKDPRNPKITSFEKCDFRPIWEKFEVDKEKKKQLTKEEKLRLKEEKQKLEEPYLYAYVDNRKEKVGNFRIEPPGLFRGRGAHPKTGMLKQRVLPEQVTLNLSKDAKVPPPPPGHKWAKIVHDQTATWLATWKENVNGTIKYVFLAQSSAWKGQSDMQKFDKARELKGLVGKIRKDYTSHLKDQDRLTRQRATAMYLIDRLALRAGNEKGDDEADTVGCCSLRAEHIELQPPNILNFDFLGKDSIRYVNSVPVETQVFKNIKQFKADALKRQAEYKKKNPKSEVDPSVTMLFDDLSTSALNKHLNNYMKGLSAKVFRTYNASHTFQQQLEKLTRKDDTVPDKMLSFNRANRDVAVLCNHQRAAPKTHDQQMGRIQDKIRALKYQRMKCRKQIFELDASYKKHPSFGDESDLDEEWIVQHEETLVIKERERIKNKFAKQNEKRKAENEPLLPESQLKDDLRLVDEMVARLTKERKTGRSQPKPNATVDKLITNITKLDQRVAATKIQATDKEENKEIALSTSKMNYIDPRITVAWAKKFDIPVEKVFNKTLQEKFRWAQSVPANWKF